MHQRRPVIGHQRASDGGGSRESVRLDYRQIRARGKTRKIATGRREGKRFRFASASRRPPRCSRDFDDHLQLDNDRDRQRSYADRGARMTPTLTDDLEHELRSSGENL